MNRLTSYPLTIFIAVPLIAILCIIAQGMLLGFNANGYIPLLAAGAVALLITKPVPPADQRAKQADSLGFARGLRLFIGLVLLIMGSVLVINSVVEFHNQLMIAPLHVNDDAPWITFTVGLSVALLGGVIIVGIGNLPRLDVTMFIVIGIFAAALFVRVYNLDTQPFGIWYDEGIYGLQVRLFQENSLFRPIFMENLTLPHLFAYVASFQAFGSQPTIVPLRVVTAILASLGVFAAYLVGRELRGAWFGVVMALLLAFTRWSINFSRLAMTGPEAVTMTLFVFYFALRVVRYGRARDAMWFGIMTAIGLYFYRPYQVQLAAMAVFLLLAYPFARRGTKTILLVITALVAALIVIAPLGVFAIDRPNMYFNRLNQVSVFTEDLPEAIGGVPGAILQGTLRHLQMFHLAGDRNGRHNLPGAPMLDPVTGALMVIGLFVALRELLFKRRWEHVFFYLSLIVALLGGILSVSFEAPQALRTIVAIVGVIYFAGLGLEASVRLIADWVRVIPPLRAGVLARGAAVVGALAAFGVIGWWNIDMYFNQQRVNFASWREHSTTETLTGRFYLNYSDDMRFFVSPLIGNGPSTTFLAGPEINRSVMLDMPDPFPLRVPADRPAAIMMLPYENFYEAYLRRIYPNGVFKYVHPVDYGVTASPEDQLFTVVEMTAEDIGAIQGLRDGRGVLFIPLYGDYTFYTDSPAQITLDGEPIESGAPVRMAQGNHAITVDPPSAADSLSWLYVQVSEPEHIPQQFLFHDPVLPNGLHAAFYNNADWSGDPVSTKILPLVFWQIHVIPMARPYSVEYTGYLYAPVDGSYTFALQAIDGASLIIDGQEVIPFTDPAVRAEINLTLDHGWHPVEIRFSDTVSSTRLYWWWMPPGAQNFAPVQREFLCPFDGVCTPPNYP